MDFRGIGMEFEEFANNRKTRTKRFYDEAVEFLKRRRAKQAVSI